MIGLTKMVSIGASLLVAGSVIAGKQHFFGMNGNPILCVPEADLEMATLRYADESVYLRPGSGHAPGFGFAFSPETMKSTIPEYVAVGGFPGFASVNHLSGSVGFTAQDDRMRWGPAMRARDIEDEWYSIGKCQTPSLEPVLNAALYEVRCRANDNYSSIWNRRPDSNLETPKPNEFVVATCQYKSISLGPYAGNTLRDCSRVLIADEFLIDYKIQRDNVKFIDDIDLFVKSKIYEWKKNCTI
jgi:hypothetical protein